MMLDHLSQKYLQAATLSLTLILSACGGGGSEKPKPAAQPAQGASSNHNAEGVYSGHLNAPPVDGMTMIILENGEFWGLYGKLINGTLNTTAFIQGQGSSNNGHFSAPNAQDFIFTPPTSVAIKANFKAQEFIKGTVQWMRPMPHGTREFTLSSTQNSNYNYNQPAKQSDIQGAWTIAGAIRSAPRDTIKPGATMKDMMPFLSTEGDFSISTSGAFSGKDNNCSYSGTIVPRPSGKNIYNASLSFSCNASPAQQATGIAMLTASNGHETLNIMTIAANSNMVAISGVR